MGLSRVRVRVRVRVWVGVEVLLNSISRGVVREMGLGVVCRIVVVGAPSTFPAPSPAAPAATRGAGAHG